MSEIKDTVCAVVVTYNRKQLLLECLEVLKKQTRPVQAIYIIDNASTDGTPEILLENNYIQELPPQDLKEPWDKEFEIKNLTDSQSIKIHYVRMHENTGGAGGFYEGVKRGYERGYDWLWLMDDDAEPKEDALEKLINFINNKREKILIATPEKVGINGEIQAIHRGFFSLKQLKQVPLSLNCYKETSISIDFSSFVGPLIKKEAIDKVGYPNKDFFIWFDDVEYSLRIKKIGKIYLVTDSIIIHKDRAERSTKNNYLPFSEYWKNYYGIRNRIYILKNHFNIKDFIIYTRVCLKAVLKIILFEPQKCKRIKLVFKACKDGINKNLGKNVNPEEWRKNA